MAYGTVSSACCCEVEALVCDAWEICKLEGQSTCNVTPTAQPVIPGYASIGRPLGPTLFDGPFWPAWHNSVTSVDYAKVQVELSVTAYRRVVVQDATSPPGCTSCPSLPPIPDAKLNCTPSAISALAGCARTEYIDNFTYELTGELSLIGGSKDQTICGFGQFDEDPGAPPGPWPYVLVDINRTGLTPNVPWVSSSNPLWWPAENRRIVPRFFGQASVTASAVPSMEFPQVAACGAIQHINRCTNVTVQRTSSVCVDAPITVIPGHNTLWDAADVARCLSPTGCPGCGYGYMTEPGSGLAASALEPYNGGSQAAWGVDIYELGLLDLMKTMFPANHAYIGSLDEVWNTITDTDRVRFLYGMLNRISPDQVFKFPDGVQKVEIHDVDFAERGHSVAMHIELRLTPVDWCKHSPDCAGLCVHSWCENGPGSIQVAFYQHGKMGPGLCGGGEALSGTIALGLEGYQMPQCALSYFCGDSATTACMQYPVNLCVARGCGGSYSNQDYVGAKPVERYHLGWKRYRNKYNNALCLNGGCTAPAVPGAVFGYSITGNGELWIDNPTGCTGPLYDSDCMDPDGDGILDCNPSAAGHPWPNNCPGGFGPLGNNCCSQFCDEQGTFFRPPCSRISIDPDFLGFYLTLAQIPGCQNFFECGGCNFEINPYFGNGASNQIAYCDCPCEATAIASADLWVDWDVEWSCGPIGTWPLYFGNTCYTQRPVPPEYRAGKVVVS